MSGFSPDIQKPSPDAMAEVTYWRGSITKWIKSSEDVVAQPSRRLIDGLSTRFYARAEPPRHGMLCRGG
jgi:hypothetical protein